MYIYIYALKFEGGPRDDQEDSSGDTCIYACFIHVEHIDRYINIYIYICIYVYIYIYTFKLEGGPRDAQEASSGDAYIYACLIHGKHVNRYIYKHSYVYTYMYIYSLKFENGPRDALSGHKYIYIFIHVKHRKMY